MQLSSVLEDVADALVWVDSSRIPFKAFAPGVGPYGEPQVLGVVVERLKQLSQYSGSIATRRTPDVLIRDHWALEFKLARPFGDNGKQAENWSVNLLHPYPGNVSAIGDCLKLLDWQGRERRAVIVIGYEHTPPQISLTPLLAAFELIARHAAHVHLSDRIDVVRTGLIHPVHQQLRVTGWEVLGHAAGE